MPRSRSCRRRRTSSARLPPAESFLGLAGFHHRWRQLRGAQCRRADIMHRKMLALEADPDGAARRVGRSGDRRSGCRPQQDLGRRAQPLSGSRARRRQSFGAAADLSRRRAGTAGRQPACAGGDRNAAPQIKRKPRPLPPPKRRLRIYALDPSHRQALDLISVFQATLSVPLGRRAVDGQGVAARSGRRISRGHRHRSGIQPRL